MQIANWLLQEPRSLPREPYDRGCYGRRSCKPSLKCIDRDVYLHVFESNIHFAVLYLFYKAKTHLCFLWNTVCWQLYCASAAPVYLYLYLYTVIFFSFSFQLLGSSGGEVIVFICTIFSSVTMQKSTLGLRAERYICSSQARSSTGFFFFFTRVRFLTEHPTVSRVSLQIDHDKIGRTN